VLDSCRTLEHEGWAVTYLPVQESGLVSLEDPSKAIRPYTVVVSVMTVIQPIDYRVSG